MNQNNISLEKVINGLECCTQHGSMCGRDCNGYWGWTDGSHTGMEILGEYRTKCPYGNCETGCVKTLAKDALALLKAQEPCVMTLGDLRDIGSVWELNTPPYLWMDICPSYRWSRGFWVAWREIYDMIDGLHPTYDADNYGKIWRCWTAKPSLKQMEETPWP